MAEKTERPRITIELTPEQTEQIRVVMGRSVSLLELSPELLEARIAPTAVWGGNDDDLDDLEIQR